MDCIEGRLLIDIIQSGEIFDIKDFNSWIYNICGNIHSYHKSRNACFKELTPYTIVIDKDQKAHLIDLQAISNEYINEYIKKDIIRERFISGKIPNIKNKYHADYFGLAKTIQFILSKVQFEPYFSNKQINKLKRITSNCLDVQANSKYQNFKELQFEFKLNSKKETKAKWKSLVFILLTIFLVIYFI